MGRKLTLIPLITSFLSTCDSIVRGILNKNVRSFAVLITGNKQRLNISLETVFERLGSIKTMIDVGI